MAQDQVDAQHATVAGPQAPPVLLLGVSGSAHSETALTAAAGLAHRLAMTVIVAYVQPCLTAATALGAPMPDDAEEVELAVITQASRVLDPLDVRWRFVLTSGTPARGLQELAEIYDAALVVVGGSSPSWSAGLWRGLRAGVAHQLLRRQSRPVLTVPHRG